MSNYRRPAIPGGCFFITVALANRDSALLVERIEALRHALKWTRARHPFEVEAMAVLPDHWHAVWRLPMDDDRLGLRVKHVKETFSRSLVADEARSESRARAGERGIWQRRYWDHAIRDERDLGAHVDYIHFNPVKHGLVPRAADWPYSSFRRFVQRGVLAPDWGDHVTFAPDIGHE